MDRDTWRHVIVRSAGLGLGLGAVGLTACSRRLDTSDVEALIKADIERQGRRLSLSAVNCPRDVTRQAGAYFRCVGELESIGTFTINVIQEDSQGNVTWEVPNSKVMLNLPKVEENIQQGLSQVFGQRALVDCGTAIYRVNQPGDRFQCQVVGGLETDAGPVDSVLVTISSEGNLTWKEQGTRAALAALPQTTVQTPGAAAAEPSAAAPAAAPGVAAGQNAEAPALVPNPRFTDAAID